MYQIPNEENLILFEYNNLYFRSHNNIFLKKNEIKDNNSFFSFQKELFFPKNLNGLVIGKNKSNIEQLKKQIKAKIQFFDGDPNSKILIQATTKEIFEESEKIVQEYLDSILKKSSFTHFIAIPCISDQNFIEICKNYLKNLPIGLKFDAYDNLNRLHFTLITLRLFNKEQIDKTCKILKNTVESFNWINEKNFEMNGINYFGENIEGPNVYYIEPKNNLIIKNLIEFQNILKENLLKENIDIYEVNKIFHITLFRKFWIKNFESININELKKTFNFEFPSIPLNSITLLKRKSYKEGTFYEILENYKIK